MCILNNINFLHKVYIIYKGVHYLQMLKKSVQYLKKVYKKCTIFEKSVQLF